MPMSPYPVLCYTPGCCRPAGYKIAARWSDGVTSELKTYGLTCEACLATWFRQARERHGKCRVSQGETLDAPGIFRMERQTRDQQLERLPDLESELSNR
ncbi:MAG TPA: hypothetical protein VH120_10110 [Gemmataceae bacterium]|jgi:hypothetical protein|nr:hypothetical protein [Gemmataceae bacterium]